MLSKSLEDTCWFSNHVLLSTLLVYLERCLEGQKSHREEVSIEGAEVFFSKQTERFQVNSDTLHIKTSFQN